MVVVWSRSRRVGGVFGDARCAWNFRSLILVCDSECESICIYSDSGGCEHCDQKNGEQLGRSAARVGQTANRASCSG